MEGENLQNDIKENVKEETSKQEFSRVFGTCKKCNKKIGLDLDGDYVACEHHPQSITPLTYTSICSLIAAAAWSGLLSFGPA